MSRSAYGANSRQAPSTRHRRIVAASPMRREPDGDQAAAIDGSPRVRVGAEAPPGRDYHDAPSSAPVARHEARDALGTAPDGARSTVGKVSPSREQEMQGKEMRNTAKGRLYLPASAYIAAAVARETYSGPSWLPLTHVPRAWMP